MGPLKGIRIVEFTGLGAAPFSAMLLSDMGAEVIRVERKDARQPDGTEVTLRGRRTIALDLKHPSSRDVALKLIDRADGLIEAFRPGVMERLGLGPEVCCARNPRLVYGRMTGFGQTGPLANAAGHDINYIAVSGALDAIGPAEKPVPPLNLLGDFGGGALYLAFGMVCAIYEARMSGKGQVVDAAMSDGAISLMSVFYGLRDTGFWNGRREENLLDGGAHFYNTYETADGKWIAIAAIEPQFYSDLLRRTGLDGPACGAHMDRSTWPAAKEKLAAIIRSKTRSEWDSVFADGDACYAPVLSMREAPDHPHNVARNAFVEIAGITQPAPAPRLSRTPAEVNGPPQAADNEAVLAAWGFSEAEIAALRSEGVC
jgi:alpha-methylacyl-CoA racemase